MNNLLEVQKISSRNSHSKRGERSVFAMKHARKLIEADAQLLANRIALLKQEELKSWKKIEEAKKKALEIYSIKLKNEEKIREVNL